VHALSILPIKPLTRTAAIVQVIAVMAGLFAWIFVSTTFGAGILGATPNGLVAHVALTGLVGLALVFVATLGDESRIATLGLNKPTDKFGTATATLIAAGGTYVVSAIVTVSAMAAFGGGIDVVDKARAMETLSTIPLWSIVPVALFAGFNEEVMFRGFLLSRFRTLFGDHRRGLVLSVLLSSALFSAGHGYQGMIGVIQTFTAGVCLATVAAIRKSLWPSIIAHAAIDLFGLVALHFIKPLLEKMLEQEGFHVPR
jgi:uncharacterized protein